RSSRLWRDVFCCPSTPWHNRTATGSGSVRIIIQRGYHRNRHLRDITSVGKKENTTRTGCSASYIPLFGRVRNVRAAQLRSRGFFLRLFLDDNTGKLHHFRSCSAVPILAEGRLVSQLEVGNLG